MTQASMEAYHSILGRLPKNRRAVYSTIVGSANIGFTVKEIAGGLGWLQNSVSGRVSELKTAGLIRDGHKRRGGQTVWIAADLQEPLKAPTYSRRAGLIASIVRMTPVGDEVIMTLVARAPLGPGITNGAIVRIKPDEK